jgi:urease accessory protein
MTRLTPAHLASRSRIAPWILAIGVHLVIASAALAHHLPPGFEDVDEFDQARMVSGFLHPFTGVDHLLLALAVGCMAFAAGRNFGSALMISFLGTLVAGMIAGRAGMALPLLEPGILLSVVLSGLMIACAAGRARYATLALAILSGLWHGNAHGGEMPGAASALPYGAALVASTALIVSAGVGLAALFSRRMEPSRRWVGAAFAVTGAWLWMA